MFCRFLISDIKSQEISINGAKKLNIEMEPEAQNLDEVVVLKLGQQKKVSVTGSMSSINNEALLKSPSASLGNAISRVSCRGFLRYSIQVFPVLMIL